VLDTTHFQQQDLAMASRSIAVPPNPSARRGKRPLAAQTVETDATDSLVIDAALRRPPRPVQPQPAHRYHVGERLRLGHGGYSVARIAASCKIVALLPYEGHGTLLYRIRSDAEAFERVVSEGDLSRTG
jgi:hypothetical protein